MGGTTQVPVRVSRGSRHWTQAAIPGCLYSQTTAMKTSAHLQHLPGASQALACRSGQTKLNTSNRGAALLAALCFATILAISLGSYMTVCYRELALSTRTVNGSHSVQLAEMG